MPKKILTAFTEQVVQFDNEQEYQGYLLGLKSRKTLYCVKDVKTDAAGKVYVTIRKQYNNNVFPDAQEGSEKKMNKNLLRSIMALHGDSDTTLAEYLLISRSRFSAKINETGGAEFNKGEITKIKQKYNLTAEQVDEIFFSQEVS